MALSKKNSSVLHEKSLTFAVSIVEFCEVLSENRHNWRLADQMLRSGTSIGANIREAFSAESNADFIHKYSISLKECQETTYWLEVLLGAKRITPEEFDLYSQKANELASMLSAAILTMKTKVGRGSR